MPILLIWSKWRDSNSRHPAPKAGALPTALHLDKYGKIHSKNCFGRPVCGKRKNHRILRYCSIFSTAAHKRSSLYLPLAALARLAQSRRASCCGARCAPRLFASVAHRPLPLAQLPYSATGGGRIAPQLCYTWIALCAIIHTFPEKSNRKLRFDRRFSGHGTSSASIRRIPASRSAWASTPEPEIRTPEKVPSYT